MKARGPDEVVHARMCERGPRPTSKHRKVVERTHLMLNLALVLERKEGSVENVNSSDSLPIMSLYWLCDVCSYLYCIPGAASAQAWVMPVSTSQIISLGYGCQESFCKCQASQQPLKG